MPPAGAAGSVPAMKNLSLACLAGLLLVREAGGVTGPFLSLGGLLAGAPVLAAAPGVAGVLSAATDIPLMTGPDLLTEATEEDERRTA